MVRIGRLYLKYSFKLVYELILKIFILFGHEFDVLMKVFPGEENSRITPLNLIKFDVEILLEVPFILIITLGFRAWFNYLIYINYKYIILLEYNCNNQII